MITAVPGHQLPFYPEKSGPDSRSSPGTSISLPSFFIFSLLNWEGSTSPWEQERDEGLTLTQDSWWDSRSPASLRMALPGSISWVRGHSLQDWSGQSLKVG